MIELGNLSPRKGSRHKKTRLGLGYSSGKGRSCTKGQKGQTSRSGHTRKESGEGGQMPFLRRIPKSGFSNVRFSKRYECVNLRDIEKLSSHAEITPQTLKEHGLIKSIKRVKILGDGRLKAALKIKAHRFSASARKKIENVGGESILLEGREPSETGEIK
jgi:large subunit ribosomal protein L15